MAQQLAARVHEQLRRRVIELLGRHRADDREVVGDAGQMRQQAGEPCAALARAGANSYIVPSSFGWPLMNANRWPLKNSSGQGWPSRFDKLRLVIEQFQLRRAAGHVQEDDLLRPRPKMRRTIRQWIEPESVAATPAAPARSPSSDRQRHAAEADVALLQEVPPRDAVQVFVSWIHVFRSDR